MNLDWDRKATWWGLTALLVVLGVAWIALTRVPAEAIAARNDHPPMPLTGFAAPDFTLETLEGETLTLSDLRGEVVLLNFWATWCPPCRAEMGAIQQVYEQYRDHDFVVLAANLQESEAQVTAFAAESGLTFPILMDRAGQVFALYQVKALPSTFFIDRAGVIREVAVGGPLPRAFIESQVAPLSAEGGGE